MIILSIVFGLLVIFSLLNVVKTPALYKNIVLVGVGFVLIILAAFRINDRDYSNYVEIFNLTPRLGEPWSLGEIHGEPGYIFLNSFIKTIGLGHTSMFAVMATLSISLNLMFYKKNTKFALIAVVIYFAHVFLLRDMLQIRAGLAASISLYALTYVGSRNFFKFTLIILTAGLFHSGALLLFIGYFIYPYFIRNKNMVYLMVILGICLGILLKQALLEHIFSNILIIPGVSNYLYESDFFSSLGLLNPVLLKNMLLLGVIIYFKDKLSIHVPNFNVLLMYFTIGIFWLSAFNNFSIIAARIATYFSNVEHILLPSLLYLNINRFLVWGIIIIYCLYMFSSKWQIFENLSFLFL